MDINKTFSVSLLLLSTFFVIACEQPEQKFVAESRPVKTIVIGGDVNGDSRTFPAIVDAIQKADISFRVTGKVSEILVKEGDRVKKGQLLARLDPTDFEIALKDKQASFDTAKANYDRAKDLVKKGAISQVDHDNIRAKYFTAKAGLDSARQNLAYTKLAANFDGYIAERYVEKFEEVVLSKKIFSLEDVSFLKIKIDVPENLMILIDKNQKNKRNVFATFDNIADKEFPLSFIERTTKADTATKTFSVSLKMDNPADYNILPGMSATVKVELLASETQTATSVTLPASAVVADNDKNATVWVVDEKTMTVKPTRVSAGIMLGNTIQVEGLKSGQRIVTAGAAFLRDNMKVSLLKTGEQAQ